MKEGFTIVEKVSLKYGNMMIGTFALEMLCTIQLYQIIAHSLHNLDVCVCMTLGVGGIALK